MYDLTTPQPTDYAELLSIWEASVRATHHFLKEEDILFFRNTIQEHNLFSQVNLTVVKEDDRILGFLGVAGDNLEMLFLHPSARGKGIGKILLSHAIDHLNITKVDVNEQNEAAAGFYEHAGFKTVSRSELDGTGKPYPILHMELQQPLW